jgi:signal transduction histidine kinase
MCAQRFPSALDRTGRGNGVRLLDVCRSLTPLALESQRVDERRECVPTMSSRRALTHEAKSVHDPESRMTKEHVRADASGDSRSEHGSNAAHRLLANKERILAQWEERLRKTVAAAGREPSSILINTLPAVLEQLAQALSPAHPRRTATDGSTVGQEHGGERVRLTHFRLEDLITEYKILRQILADVLDENSALPRDERNTLNASLDQMLIEACAGYALVQSSFRDQFFATVAHDLRNPLGAAQASAALIARDPHADGVAGWATRIIDNIGHADRMVRDLLDAMRVQTGARLTLEIKPCDLVDVVRQSIDRFHTEAGERIVLVASGPVRGYLAPDAIQRAVENLTSNALKYGDRARAVTVTVSGTHGRGTVAVHNHGPVIRPEQRETLFHAFQRLTDAETSGKSGWGLGLAQVRAVAEAHGGSIGVDSLPGRGTTFTIDIPLDARPYQNRPTTPPT